MNELIGLVTGRPWLMLAVSLALVAVIACETGSDGGVAPDVDGQLATRGTADPDASSGDQATPSGEIAVPAGGGINEDCIRRVLGRDAAGFGDVSAAERNLILTECTGDDGSRTATGRRGAGAIADFQFGGGALAALDPECVQGITGDVGSDFAQMTPEQRQSVFQECGVGTAPGADGGFDGFGGSFFGRDGFTGQLPDCATDSLGTASGNLQNLTREDFQAITEACGDELGGFGGFGGDGFFGQGGRTGGFGGGFFGQDGAGQLSECATEALGAASGDLQNLTREDFQAITEACGSLFGGGQ